MTYPLNHCRNHIIAVLKKHIPNYSGEFKLETPPEPTWGDVAVPCFSFASLYKKSPHYIATDLASKIQPDDFIDHAEARGPYINFFINNHYLTKATLTAIFEKKKMFGWLEKKEKKVIIEHTSANPNGPLHVGRARNPIIGDTLVRIFKAAGYTVESQFYLDDMGKQVAILTWGVNSLDKTQVPESENKKPDHTLVRYYQKANEMMQTDDNVIQAINQIIQKLEQGDKDTLDMVHHAYTPVLTGIQQSLNRINISIDTFIAESQFVLDKSVEQVIHQLKKMSICGNEEGAYFLDLESYGIQGRNTLFYFLRKDGTTLYATRDIAYHIWKANQADILINVLGEDHKLESKQVEIVLRLLNQHIIPTVVFYAFVSLPGGKMSTRKGRVVFLDDLVEESIERAYKEVKKRRANELTEQQMKHIAELVGVGSLRYNIIKVQPEKDIEFKWEEALNFEGNAVPFIQYAHARACSILAKTDEQPGQFTATLLTHISEIQLIKQLARFPDVISEASDGYKPHIIATFLYETAAAFNLFYRDCPVLAEKNKLLRLSRLSLVSGARTVLHNALQLYGIEAPEEM